MELPEKIAELLQAQLTRERTNAEVYDALAAGLLFEAWPGAASYMARAANEERTHAAHVRDYLTGRDVRPVYGPIDPAPLVLGDEMTPYFEAALQIEHATTQDIVVMHMAAWNEVDLQTCTFLLGLVEEQTKSESDLRDILQELGRFESDPKLIDNDLAGR